MRFGKAREKEALEQESCRGKKQGREPEGRRKRRKDQAENRNQKQEQEQELET